MAQIRSTGFMKKDCLTVELLHVPDVVATNIAKGEVKEFGLKEYEQVRKVHIIFSGINNRMHCWRVRNLKAAAHIYCLVGQMHKLGYCRFQSFFCLIKVLELTPSMDDDLVLFALLLMLKYTVY